MVGLTIDIREVDELGKTLRRVADRVSDLRPAYELVYADLQEREEKVFRLGGTPQRWAPLSPRYAAWKRKHHPGRPIMELTGRLLQSLVGKTGESVAQIERQRAVLGTRAPHAHLHDQEDRRRKNLPRRPLLQVTPYIRRQWQEIIGDYASEVVGSELSGTISVRLRQARRRRR